MASKTTRNLELGLFGVECGTVGGRGQVTWGDLVLAIGHVEAAMSPFDARVSAFFGPFDRLGIWDAWRSESVDEKDKFLLPVTY